MSQIKLYRQRADIRKQLVEEHARHGQTINALNEKLKEVHTKLYFDKAQSIAGKCFKIRMAKYKHAPFNYYRVTDLLETKVRFTFFSESIPGTNNDIKDLFYNWLEINFDRLKAHGFTTRNIISREEYNKAAEKWSKQLLKQVA